MALFVTATAAAIANKEEDPGSDLDEEGKALESVQNVHPRLSTDEHKQNISGSSVGIGVI